jgi:hypothetical protein
VCDLADALTTAELLQASQVKKGGMLMRALSRSISFLPFASIQPETVVFVPPRSEKGDK